MAGYTRQSTFQDGDTITAALFNDEYDQLLNVFSNTSGHKHDGTAAEGPVIGLIGDAGLVTPLNKILIDTTNDHIEFWLDVSGTSTQQLYIADGAILPVTDNDIDLGSSSLEFKDLFIDGTANIDSLVADTADINGGTLDNVTIGATTAAAGTFTTVTTTSNVVVGGNLTVSGTTTTVNSNEVNIGDNIIVLNSDETGTPSQDGGIEIERGTSTNVSLLWNETNDYWTFGSNHLNFPDNSKAYFGAGNDLQIYHDGSASYINDQGTGPLYLKGNTVTAVNLSDVAMFTAIGGNKVGLNYNGNEKLATTPTGINVTGTATATAFSGPLTGNVTGDVTGNVAGNLTGSVLTAAQTNITSLGTLSSLAVSGDLTVDTNTLYVDSTNNRVGIGTTSPSSVLDLTGLGTTQIEFNNTGQSSTSYIGNDATGLFVGTTTNHPFRVATNNTERARIDSSGNLGIGTSSPLALLHVEGNALVTGNLTVNGNLTFGNANTDTVSFGADIDSHIIPDDDNTYDLGSASQEWKDLYIDGVIYADQIDLGDNEKIRLGASQDLEIYHDGSHSYVKDNGTGSLRIRGTDLILESQAGEAYLYAANNGAVTLYHDNSAKLATTSTGIDVTGTAVVDGLTSSGSVAITTTSGLPLTVSGHDTWNYPLRITNTTASTNLDLKQGTGGASILTTSAALTFQTASTERARFTATGLGIGTTSPLAKLESYVSGNFSTTYNDFSGDGLYIQTNGTAGVGEYTAGLSFSRTVANNARAAGIAGVQDGSDADQVGLAFFTHPSTGTAVALQESLRISSDGKVGIGETNPDTALDVVGGSSDSVVNTLTLKNDSTGNSAGTAINFVVDGVNDVVSSQIISQRTGSAYHQGSLQFVTRDSGGGGLLERMRINQSGNVGIGTTSPDTLLNLAGDETAVIRLENSNGSASDGDVIGALQFYKADASGAGAGVVGQMKMLTQGVGSGGHLTLSTGDANGNDAERLRISSNGNVGIGTNSPSALLHVAGDATIDGNLTVSGTTLTINTTNLNVEDKNITVNYSTGDSSSTADGAGITIQDAVNSTTDATFTWNATDDNFEISHGLDFGDNTKARFGAGSDLQIYHDGSNSYIQDAGTGNLYIEGTNLILRAADDSRYLQAVDGASGYTALYHPATDGQKLATTSTGIDVTGLVKVTDQFQSISGSRTLVMNANFNSLGAIGMSSNDHLTFVTNNTERMRLDNSGRLGLNTTDPDGQGYSYAEDLVILGGNSADDGVGITLRGNGKRYGILAFGDNADPNSGEIFYDHTANSMSFRTNDQIAATIDSSGNLTVGTGISYNASADDTLIIGATNRTSVNNGTYFNYQLKVSGAATGQDLTLQAARNIDGSSDDVESIFQYDASSDAQIFFTNATERMRIDSSGRLLVGKTAVDNTTVGFRFDGASGFASFVRDGGEPLYLNRKTSDGDVVKIAKDGTVVGVIGTQNWGIGTTSPDSKLHIVDALGGGQLLVATSEADNAEKYGTFGTQHYDVDQEPVLAIAAQSSSSENNVLIGGALGEFNAATSIKFFTAANATTTTGSERMRIDASGNVGIGVTNPSQKLDVAGTIYSSNSGTDGGQIRLANSGGGSTFYWAARTTGLNLGELGAADGRIFVKNGGNVGIGTSSPSDNLHVVGDIRINSNTPQLKFTSADNSSNSYYIGANISDSVDGGLQIGEGTALGSNVRLAIDGSGNVGIGTTSPDSLLHLETTTNPTLSFYRNDSGILTNNGIGQIQFGGSDSGDTNDAAIIRAQAETGWGASSCPTRLSFWTTPNGATSASERMRIDKNGSVGIGSSDTTPGKVHIAASNTAGLIVKDTSSSAAAPHIRVNGARSDANGSQSFSGGLALDKWRTGGLVTDNSRLGTIYFGGNHTDGTESNIEYTASISATAEGDFNSTSDMPTGLQFFTGDSGDSLGTANSTYGSPRMTIDHDGNVGIGTSTVSRGPLEIHKPSTGDCQIHLTNTSTGTGASNGTTIYANTNSGIWHRENGYFNIATNNTERLRIDSSGNVGIGTTNPSSEFHLSSAAPVITATATNAGSGLRLNVVGGGDVVFRIQDNGTERFRLNSSGNVGIGTTSPNGKLDVFTGTSGSNADISGMDNGSIIFGNASSSTAAPSIVGKSNNNVGLILQSATNDSNTSADMHFNVRENNNSDFSTTTTAAFQFRRFATVLATILRNGNLGLGTTTPSANLHINKSDAQIRLQHAGNSFFQRIFTDSSNNLKFGTGSNGTERLRIDSSGRVGIGTTNPSHKLDIVGGGLQITEEETTDAIALLDSSNSNTKYFSIQGDNGDCNINAPAGELVLQRAGTQRLTVGTSGVTINGALSKSSGSFKIDHPLKPNTHHLVHSFVEGPQADNLYRGVIELNNGKATIDLDDWFGMTAGTFLALNRDIQAFVNNSETWDAVRANVQGSQLVIECQNSESNAEVAWLVIGERQDKEIHESILTDDNGKIIVEPQKVTEE
jgi:hypothetical protein